MIKITPQSIPGEWWIIICLILWGMCSERRVWLGLGLIFLVIRCYLWFFRLDLTKSRIKSLLLIYPLPRVERMQLEYWLLDSGRTYFMNGPVLNKKCLTTLNKNDVQKVSFWQWRRTNGSQLHPQKQRWDRLSIYLSKQACIYSENSTTNLPQTIDYRFVYISRRVIFP